MWLTIIFHNIIIYTRVNRGKLGKLHGGIHEVNAIDFWMNLWFSIVLLLFLLKYLLSTLLGSPEAQIKWTRQTMSRLLENTYYTAFISAHLLQFYSLMLWKIIEYFTDNSFRKINTAYLNQNSICYSCRPYNHFLSNTHIFL